MTLLAEVCILFRVHTSLLINECAFSFSIFTEARFREVAALRAQQLLAGSWAGSTAPFKPRQPLSLLVGRKSAPTFVPKA